MLTNVKMLPFSLKCCRLRWECCYLKKSPQKPLQGGAEIDTPTTFSRPFLLPFFRPSRQRRGPPAYRHVKTADPLFREHRRRRHRAPISARHQENFQKKTPPYLLFSFPFLNFAVPKSSSGPHRRGPDIRYFAPLAW